MGVKHLYTQYNIMQKGFHLKQLFSLIGKFFYVLMGWKFESLPPYFSRKHVIIGFPHTSNMDAVRAFVAYRIIKRTGHIMVKKEWFFWPMSLVFKIIGGIPIDRQSSRGVVQQMADIFKDRDEFLLAIVPEGTRKKVKTIKTGFWQIAKAADVSIICWFLDNANKKARWLGEIIPGDNMMNDLIRIRDIYEKAGYRFPLDNTSPGHENNRISLP
jgi:1-acyl-sn-glycerol-3-phosphate acyltransferase